LKETLLQCNSTGDLQAVFFKCCECDEHANYAWNQH